MEQFDGSLGISGEDSHASGYSGLQCESECLV